MKTALGQINTTVGAVGSNVQKMIEYASRAKAAGADLIVFHESCIPGYPPKELASRPDFVAANLKGLEQLKQECRGIGVVCSYIEREEQSGGKIYDTAALLSDGAVALCHRKNILSASSEFDERLHFSEGKGGAVCEFRGVKIGLTMSEDAWTDKDFWEARRSRRTLPGKLVREVAGLLIIMASSPFWPGKQKEREKAARALALRYGVAVVYVNQAGGNDSLIFDGGSFAVSAEGLIVARAKRFEEDLVTVEMNSAVEVGAARENDIVDVRKALVLGVRDFVRKCGFEKAVLGLSGGIDSAVTACIAVEALGRENVLAVVMPSMYSLPESLHDASVLAENLGIERRTVSIEPVYNAYIESLRGEFAGLPEDVAEENIQARIRGNLLMAFSNKFGHLVLATGNRSEAMTGYCTLYGDAAGGLAVIADVPKKMVYGLAEDFNRDRELIPRRIFDREPSAELKPNQKDADTLPPYPILDPILEALLDEGKTPDEVVAMGYDGDVVRDLVRRIYRSEHKRKQSPPALFVSRSALVPGRARPIAPGAVSRERA